MAEIISILKQNIPPAKAMIYGTPPALIWAYFCLYFAGYLKIKKGLNTGYTRKVFHFLIFATVVFIQLVWGLPIVLLFGAMTSIVIFYAISRGGGHLLYEAIAREKDAPHRTHYVLVPYFATLIGGVISNILFGPLALIGYLVTGLGDAAGEPFGTRFGKHTYKVPSLLGAQSKRSYEGSAAVLVTCLLAVSLGIFLSPQLAPTKQSFIMVPVLALICMVLEAVSPRGWDNATMQIIPTYLAKCWFFSIDFPAVSFNLH